MSNRCIKLYGVIFGMCACNEIGQYFGLGAMSPEFIVMFSFACAWANDEKGA